MMYRYKCTIAYEGAAYEGWQSQKNGRSIQEQVEAVLQRLTGKKINVIASGRTDAGVSASAQVCMFDTDRHMTGRKWQGAINAFLPDDIHIVKCEEADPVCFHARYNVRWKKYVYRIHMGEYDVFTRNIACQCPLMLDTDAMREAIPYLIGTHDFTSCNSSPLSEYPDQVRTVFDIDMKVEGNMITLTFRGKGFLRFMVRMMAGALMEVGKHKHAPSYIKEMLDAKDKSFPHKNAPANGLRLEEVNYFDILSLSEEGMVREFLYNDVLPEGYTITQLEEMVKKQEGIVLYAFTTRHSQEMLGIFVKDENQGILYVYDEKNLPAAKSLEEGLSAWCTVHIGPGALHIKTAQVKS